MNEIKRSLVIVVLMTTLSTIIIGCQQKSSEASTADINEKTDSADVGGDGVVKLIGLYRLQPEDKSLDVDIKVDFKEGNDSEWITNINGNEDRIPKKYKIFEDALYVTHDLAEFDRVIADARQKGNTLAADVAEQMIRDIPETDKYKIELLENDSIKLVGSRINFYLLKIGQ